MDAKRGFVPEDERNFSSESSETMRMASRHICYLINEGYDLKQAATFVGNCSVKRAVNNYRNRSEI